MKTLFTSLITLLVITSIYAQQGINYKAVIKDDVGNVIANETIEVEFAIIEGGNDNTVFSENHIVTTDENGIFIANIGNGVISSGSFDTIDWPNQVHYLNVQVIINSQATDLGTTLFKYVPYAIHADTATRAAIANNVTGLEVLNEGNGNGWRLKGQLPEFYGNLGLLAVDLSFNGSASTIKGATGSYALATGNSTIASGDFSFASGFNSSAFGNYSTALGRLTAADGNQATAIGFGAAAIGDNSTAIGFGTVAYATNETVIGSYNEPYTPGNSNTDRLFVVGNGTSSNNTSNAFTILNNGRVGIGTNLPNGLLGVQRNSNSSVPQLELIEDQPDDGARIDFINAYETNNKWTLYGRSDNTNTNSEFNIFYSGGAGNIMSLRGNGDVYVNGSLAHSSDRRLKKDIKDLSYGLTEILQLQPKEYFWKDRLEQNDTSLGLIAQEVKHIISNVVHEGNDTKKTLSISYTELIPVLINAIKEQQQIITNQYTNYTSLLERVEALENNTKEAKLEYTATTLETKKDK